jgi:predicted dehydrogenase
MAANVGGPMTRGKQEMARKMRFAVIGTGGRSEMFWNALAKDAAITRHNKLVALMDPNVKRMNFVNRKLGMKLPHYRPHQFEEMLKKEKLDAIVVTTRDSVHDQYIVRGLEAGLKVVSEKPMTTDEHKCQRILDAMRGREKNLVVTFNYRYAPHVSKVKELVMKGAIGELTMVQFDWYLDITHGADYYRRWHRQKTNSGSLWVHKSTHHFDLVNWIAGGHPELVYAQGTKRFYRPETFPPRERCLTCDARKKCKFHLELKSPKHKGLYLDAETEDGYFRDRCVFSPDIDIWDTRAATVTYDDGMLLSYSLNNYAPFEGYRLGLVGTEGRIELNVHEHSYISGAGGKLSRNKGVDTVSLRHYPLFKPGRDVAYPQPQGSHGGGDVRLLADCFLPHKKKDPLRTAAGGVDGAYSILIGIAARRSIEWGRAVRLDELVNFEATD